MSVLKDEDGDLTNTYSVISLILKNIPFPRPPPAPEAFLYTSSYPRTIWRLSMLEQLPIRWRVDLESLCTALEYISSIREAGKLVTDSPSCWWLTQPTWVWNSYRGDSGGMKVMVHSFTLCKALLFLWTF